MHIRVCRIRTSYRTRPQPRNNLQLLANILLQIRPDCCHFCSNLNLRIQMANALLCLFTHPMPIAPHVLSKTTCPRPILDHFARLSRSGLYIQRQRPHWRAASKLRRDLDHRLIDEHSNGIQVTGMAFQTQTLRFKRYSSTTRKRVMKSWQLGGIEEFSGLRVLLVELTSLLPALANFRTRPLQHFFVVGVFPLHQITNDVEQSLAFASGFFLVHPPSEAVAGLVSRIVDHLCEQNSTRCSKRSSRPPQMQRTRMPMPDRLLAHSGRVDVI